VKLGGIFMNNIYDFKVKDYKGNEVSLEQYKGKVLLIVNTATKCGFTPQYTELEELYKKYKDQGFEILDFPCNQFFAQAPGTSLDIHEGCVLRFAIEFPQFEKINVNGKNEIPLYRYLKDNVVNGSKNNIKWNFTKFLVDREGNVVRRFEPTESLDDVRAAVKELL
jgi:glutathione peroxidase